MEVSMYDFIYHRGNVVARINLGDVFSEANSTKIGALSGGKIFSTDGKVLGSFRGASDPSPDKSLSAAFCAALNIAA
jgi:hypothetical protein